MSDGGSSVAPDPAAAPAPDAGAAAAAQDAGGAGNASNNLKRGVLGHVVTRTVSALVILSSLACIGGLGVLIANEVKPSAIGAIQKERHESVKAKAFYVTNCLSYICVGVLTVCAEVRWRWFLNRAHFADTFGGRAAMQIFLGVEVLQQSETLNSLGLEDERIHQATMWTGWGMVGLGLAVLLLYGLAVGREGSTCRGTRPAVVAAVVLCLALGFAVPYLAITQGWSDPPLDEDEPDVNRTTPTATFSASTTATLTRTLPPPDPCACLAEWSFGGEGHEGCQWTPSLLQACVVAAGSGGGVAAPCAAATAVRDEAADGRSVQVRPCRAEPAAEPDALPTCECAVEWTSPLCPADAGLQAGCPATACSRHPLFVGASWCRVANAPCKEAPAANATYAPCTPPEEPGACECAEQWEHDGAAYEGCATTPSAPGQPWCKVRSFTCRTATPVSAAEGSYLKRNCTDGLGAAECLCDSEPCQTGNGTEPYCVVSNAPCRTAPAPTGGGDAYGVCRSPSPPTAAPPTDAPSTDAPSTPAPQTAVPDTDAPPTALPATPQPKEATPSPPETPFNATLTEEVEAGNASTPTVSLAAAGSQDTAVPDTSVPDTEAPTTEAPPVPPSATETVVVAANATATAAWNDSTPATATIVVLPPAATPEPASTQVPDTAVPDTVAPDTRVPATPAPTCAHQKKAGGSVCKAMGDVAKNESGVGFEDCVCRCAALPLCEVFLFKREDGGSAEAAGVGRCLMYSACEVVPAAEGGEAFFVGAAEEEAAPEKKKGKAVAAIVVVLLLLLCCSGGAWWWNKRRRDEVWKTKGRVIDLMPDVRGMDMSEFDDSELDFIEQPPDRTCPYCYHPVAPGDPACGQCAAVLSPEPVSFSLFERARVVAASLQQSIEASLSPRRHID
eukprot:Rhum_TRINITY_DN514_c0_g1::Rhum_TRINITY_DN514_c0_g1_i1::g.1654::m.1654